MNWKGQLAFLMLALACAAGIALASFNRHTITHISHVQRKDRCTVTNHAACNSLLIALIAACRRRPRVCSLAVESVQRGAGPRQVQHIANAPRASRPSARRAPARTPGQGPRRVTPSPRTSPPQHGGSGGGGGGGSGGGGASSPSPPPAQPPPPPPRPTPTQVVQQVLQDPVGALSHPQQTTQELTCSLGVTSCPP